MDDNVIPAYTIEGLGGPDKPVLAGLLGVPYGTVVISIDGDLEAGVSIVSTGQEQYSHIC